MVSRETRVLQGLREIGIDPVDGALSRLVRFEELLRRRAIPMGIVGPQEAGRLLERHILDAAALHPLLPDAGGLVDVGTGSGLPGIVLACLRKGPVTLLDAERRRISFVREAVRDLDIPSAVAIHARAEAAARSEELRAAFDAAVARAVAPVPVVLELTLPFVRVGGRVVIPTGFSQDADAAARAARILGGGDPQWILLQVPGSEADRCAMIVDKVDVTPERYPRRDGVPARRPLGMER